MADRTVTYDFVQENRDCTRVCSPVLIGQAGKAASAAFTRMSLGSRRAGRHHPVGRAPTNTTVSFLMLIIIVVSMS